MHRVQMHHVGLGSAGMEKDPEEEEADEERKTPCSRTLTLAVVTSVIFLFLVNLCLPSSSTGPGLWLGSLSTQPRAPSPAWTAGALPQQLLKNEWMKHQRGSKS